MTERDWLASDDPLPMLDWLLAGRGLGLFGDSANLPMVPAPHYPDAKFRQWMAACATEGKGCRDEEGWVALYERGRSLKDPGGYLNPPFLRSWAMPVRGDAGRGADLAFRAGLLREIFGNPFRSARFDWHDLMLCDPPTRRIPFLARAIYEGRDWAALPILADALEEAGCPAEGVCPSCEGSGNGGEDEAVGVVFDCRACEGSGRVPSPLLAHLRSPSTHVRGCWALDLVRGAG